MGPDITEIILYDSDFGPGRIMEISKMREGKILFEIKDPPEGIGRLFSTTPDGTQRLVDFLRQGGFIK